MLRKTAIALNRRLLKHVRNNTTDLCAAGARQCRPHRPARGGRGTRPLVVRMASAGGAATSGEMRSLP